MLTGKELKEYMKKETLRAVEVNSSIDSWAKSLGINLFPNQLEIMEAILNPSIRNLVVLASRAGGKTFTISVGIVKNSIENKGYRTILTAPKADQSLRIIADGILPLCQNNPSLYNEVDWERTSKKEFRFKNGSWIRAIGGGETTQVEGFHCDMLVTDEAHAVSSYVYRVRLQPMNQDSAHQKNIKIGITLYDNHFRESAHNPKWKVLIYPWEKCPNLFKSNDLTEIDGKKYPTGILEQMPRSLKIKRWPNHPELHTESSTGMSEEDFLTQYEMQWVDTIAGILSQEDQSKLFGDHEYLYKALPGETYYFGLDFAGGKLIEKGQDRDSTQLVILRKTPDNVKEVVACYTWQGDTEEQSKQIINIITKVFPCAFGLADYSSMGISIVDQFMNANIPIAGVSFKAKEPITGKNYKNAMFDQFLFELRQDRFKYPNINHMLNSNGEAQTEEAQLLNEHFFQWCSLERRKMVGINDEISAPKNSSVHDDAPMACVMAVWAADKADEEKRELGLFRNSISIARPVFGTSITGRSGMPSGNKSFGFGR